MKRFILAFTLCFVFVGPVSVCFSADDLKITKDKDGTTWSVGSDESREKKRAEEDRDKDRAWDMLKNQSIILDRRSK